MFPNGPGSFAQAARGGTDRGANWSQVSDRTPDDDTKYVTDGAVGDRDSYAYSDIVLSGGSILAVMNGHEHARTTQAHALSQQWRVVLALIRQA